MSNFSETQIQNVWNKGLSQENYNSDKYRKDCCGAWIKRDDYGKNTSFGWTVDHVYPESKGGSNDLLNLRPMQWENNLSKSDDYPSYTSVKTSEGEKNIKLEKNWTVNEELRNELLDKFGNK